MQSTFEPIPRPLKRSASVASLPTPPPTRHKRKRAGSKHSRASDDDLSATDDNDDDDEKLIKEAEAEESFWLATNAAAASSTQPPLLYRRLQAQSKSQTQQLHGVPPVSPPPSHRKPPGKAIVLPHTPTPKSTSSTISPPTTPTRASILRDSPDNPFLASPLGSQDEVVVNESSLLEEKPTMAFVFRGVRRSFPNPYYNASRTSPNPNSQLPPEHPDFEPEERGVRKLLFGVRKNAAPPKKGGRRVAQAAGRGRRAAAAASTSRKSDEEADELPTTPTKAKADMPTTPTKPKPKRAAAA
ncbi:hypothetical protein DFH08DRAFT_849303 [Mycena albidolilacea]|uniref:Uncharacterized protein n=1 Tax=Mycena albidolilacea TaxID=1033008 RepID=A0AAD7AED6_9AGAR|nr:hypothetical protein DFH08DRAFT_849303 [Mycena albidolilacea]